MTEQQLFSKIYAGWMGKNIGGTLGGPLEGRMELMDIKFYTQEFVGAVENDDLDLQLINLHCVEQYGGRADSALLSQEWKAHVHFQFDEYGHSLSNMRRGLHSPLSGRYNNFFTDCMGSPIRSEIWAMLCAGMPDLAAFYAYHDATVDHAGGEGVYGEIFFAVLESLAFVSTDINYLIKTALSYLPEDSAVRLAVECLLDCHEKGMSWQAARQVIIDRFAGENFTYAPVNIAFTLVGLLWEKGFTQQMLTTVNCGYDTDCTVATLGSLLGILYGPDYIDKKWIEPLGENIIVSRPITGFDPPKNITELADRTIAARRIIQEHYNQTEDKSAFVIPYDGAVEILKLPLGSHKKYEFTVTIEHENGSPAFAPGQTKNVKVSVRNHRPISAAIDASLELPAGFAVSGGGRADIPSGEAADWTFTVTAPVEKQPIWRCTLSLTEYIGQMLWTEHRIPLSFLPTIDWTISCGGETKRIFCETNCVLPGAVNADTLTAETAIFAPTECASWIKIICRKPIRAWLDGKEIICCDAPTAEIPAYHRADPRKCAEIALTKGEHALKIEVGKADEPGALFVCLVEGRDNYWALQIDKTFS